MNKKELIIEKAADMFHEHGYHKLGIKSILDATQTPKGSFYHYFDSKEDLMVHVVDYHINGTSALIQQFPFSVEGMSNLFNCYFGKFEEFGYKRGCAIGNLAQELADESEVLRLKLLEWYNLFEGMICASLINDGVEEVEAKALASFIVSAFQGVLLKGKLERDNKTVEEFRHYIFEGLLPRYIS